MFKLVLFVNRRPDISHQEFRDHYENVHVPLATAGMPQIRHYVRNYLSAFPGQPEPPYDCVTEMWYDDQAAFAETVAWNRTEASRELHEDEDKFMDRASMKAFVAAEHGTGK